MKWRVRVFRVGIKETLSRAQDIEVSVASIGSLFLVLTPKEYMTQYLKKKKKAKDLLELSIKKNGNLLLVTQELITLALDSVPFVSPSPVLISFLNSG